MLRFRLVAAAAAVGLAVGVVSGPAVPGAQAAARPKVGKLDGKMAQAEKSVPGVPWKPVPVPAAKRVPGATVGTAVFPSAATAVVAIPSAANMSSAAMSSITDTATGTGLVAAGSTGVSVGPAKPNPISRMQTAAGVTTPSPGGATVSVATASHAAAVAAGVNGTLVSIARTDGQTGSAAVQVAVDYSTFAQAFGGDFGGRLTLVALPACALTTPSLAQCRAQTPVTFVNDSAHHRLVGTVTVPGAKTPAATAPAQKQSAQASPAPDSSTPKAAAPAPKMVLAATSSATSSSGAGTYAATTLSASNNWGAAGNSGSFTYSYPITVPQPLGGAAPGVALSYDSGAIDGKTAIENSQPSWVGDGWDYNPGFIERATVPCSAANPTKYPSSSDNCYARDSSGNLLPAYSISFNGHGGVLLHDDSDPTGTVFKTQNDDGTKITLLTGSPSASADAISSGQYFRVQSPDGSIAYFGAYQLPAEMNGGTWGSDTPTQGEEVEPLFNNPNNAACGDPGAASTTAKVQACRTVYRWLLDYQVDPHGDVTKYLYSREGDTSYQHWYTGASTYIPAAYTRAATLAEIDYSWQTADVAAGHVPGAKVVFNKASRCVDPQLPNGAATPYSANAGAGAAGCSTAASTSYPAGYLDTPTDLTSISNTVNPSFWTRYRLASIDTYVTVGTTPTPVDHYDFFYQFHNLPDGGTTVPSPLWLEAIRHCASSAVTTTTGGICPQAATAPGQSSLPDVQFTGTGTAMPNRVPGVKDANGNLVTSLSTYPRERIGTIYTEMGAQIGVAYDDPTNFAPLGCTTPPTSETPAVQPDWHNHQLCYPEYWTPPSLTAPITDWFHKYVVTSVTVNDETSAATSPVKTVYAYDTALGAAWHSNDSELVTNNKYRTYDQYQGFQTVTTTTGTPLSQTNDKGHPQTQTVSKYLRGMDQDMDLAAFNSGGAGGCNGTGINPAADCPRVSVTDGQGGSTYDDVIFAGTLLETTSYEMPDNTVSTPTLFSDSVTRPWDSDPIATRTRIAPLPAYRSRQTGSAVTITATPMTGGRTRTVSTEYFHDQANGGRIVYTDTLAPTPADANDPELCTTTGYAPGAPSTTRIYLTYADTSTIRTGPCLATAGPVTTGAFNPATAPAGTIVSGTQTWYDANYTSTGNRTDSVAKGDTVETDALSGAAGTAGTMTKQSTATFDAYGRILTATDAMGTTTSTAYTPATGTQPTSATVTGPGVTDTFGTATQTTKTLPGFTSTTAFNLREQPTDVTDANNRVTHTDYDALGRTVAGWAPDHPKITYNSQYQGHTLYPNKPSVKYVYTVSGQPPGLSGTTLAPSTVETDTLREDGTYSPALTLLDSLGRTRQTQDVPVSGDAGRVITDTTYDSLGRVNVVSGPQYDATTAPTGTYYTPPNGAQTAWLTQNQTLYDGLGRTTDAVTLSQAAELWRTHTAYPGVDRTDVTPPAGGTPTSTVTDARGHTEALYTYHATSNQVQFGTTTYDSMTYGYDPAGRQNLVTDAAGNHWTTTYDLLGRKMSFTDPSAGTSTYLYDMDGRVTDSQDARGAAGSLHDVYDTMGRISAEYNQYAPTSLDPSKLQATYSYDSLDGGATFTAKGQAIGSTRYGTGGQTGTAYTEAVTALDLAYRPLTAKTVIPTGDGNGALAGTYTTTNVYTPMTGLLDHSNLPAAGNPATGGLAADTVTNGYSQNGLLTASADNYADLLTDSGYSPFGQIERRMLGDYPNQVVSDMVYDAATGRISNTTLSQLSWNKPIDTTAYLYDQSGSITATIDKQATASTTTNGIVNATVVTDTQCFTYDYAHRLTGAWTDNTIPVGSTFGTVGTGTSAGSGTANPPAQTNGGDLGSCTDGIPSTANRAAATTQVNSGPAPYWQTFTYDNPTGNRLDETDYSPAGDTTKDVTATFTYGNNGGQPYTLTAKTVNNQTPASMYGYDPAGNLAVSPGGTSGQRYVWDPAGQLQTVTLNSTTTTAQYVYDAAGTQLIRRDPTTNTTTLYLGSAEIHLNTTSGAITGDRYFTYAGSPTVVETGGNNPTLGYEAGNLQGTSSAVIAATPTAASNAVTARRAYTPFNTPRTAVSPTGIWAQSFPDDHTFLGKSSDSVTGLVDMGSRKYDPNTGRFLTVDPVFQPADPQAVGGYAYAADNAVDNIDPTGRDCHGATPSSCTNDGPGGNGGSTYQGSTCTAICQPGQTVGAYAPECSDGSFKASCASSDDAPTITVVGPSGRRVSGRADKPVTEFTGKSPNQTAYGSGYWSEYYGYNGSPEMTWQDVMNWATSSEKGWNFLCGQVMGSTDCDFDPFTGASETGNYTDLARGLWNNRETILNAGATLTCVMGSVPSCAKASVSAFGLRTADHVAKDGISATTLGEVSLDAGLSTITFIVGATPTLEMAKIAKETGVEPFETAVGKWSFTLAVNSPSIMNNLVFPLFGVQNTPPAP